MKYFILLVAACFTFKADAQFFSTKLQHKLDGNAASEKFHVNIYLKNNQELTVLKHTMRNEQVPVIERPARVKSVLKSQADFSQQALIDFAQGISSRESEFEVRARYNIVNMVSAEVSANVLWGLTQFPGVEWICLRDEIQLKYDAPVAMERVSGRSLGGHEPGHDAIHAPFMWNLGYTGLGRRLYTVDTGIWTVHPAVSRQYRGNYMPEAHCWLGFDFPHPADKPDAHGTHVTGTVLGLDPATSDTIGLAFNASYIATDPIVEDIADVRPLEAILAAFEFALDPDGDPNTNDVPDVICNSWGFGDTIVDGLCTNPIVIGLFEALDAAGIAVEFSAGNEGPGTATMGMPAYVVLDSVNVFSVGADIRLLIFRVVVLRAVAMADNYQSNPR
jgi:bacillopeptidase F